MEKIKTQRLCISILAILLSPASYANQTIKVSLSDAITRSHQSDPQRKQLWQQYQQQSFTHKAQQRVKGPQVNQVQSNYNPLTNANQIASQASWDLPFGIGINAHLSHKADLSEPKLKLQAKIPVTKLLTTDYALKISQLKTQQRDIELQHAYEQSVLDLIKLYRQTILSQYSQEAQDKVLELVKHQVAQQTAHLQAGQISKYELDQSLYKLQSEGLKSIRAEKRHQQLLHKLKRKIGIDVNQEIEIDSSFAFKHPTIHIEEHLQGYTPPQSKIAELNHQIIQAQHWHERSQHWPQLNINTEIDETGAYQIGIDFSIQPLTPARHNEQMANHYAQLNQENHFLNEQLEVESSIHDAYDSVVQLQYDVELSAQALKLAQMSFNIESVHYKHQQISAFEFLEATQKLRDEYINALETHMQYANQIDALHIQLGCFNETLSHIL